MNSFALTKDYPLDYYSIHLNNKLTSKYTRITQLQNPL